MYNVSVFVLCSFRQKQIPESSGHSVQDGALRGAEKTEGRYGLEARPFSALSSLYNKLLMSNAECRTFSPVTV
ncbi:hypothetical protein J6590_104060 [Homalodisca vitripennis]|nr:hypothetical protein J6590_104060 [Homalodisca vitripennis]